MTQSGLFWVLALLVSILIQVRQQLLLYLIIDSCPTTKHGQFLFQLASPLTPTSIRGYVCRGPEGVQRPTALCHCECKASIDNSS